MSRSTVTHSCRWCGQEYSKRHEYNCCGERCYREWATVNPEQFLTEYMELQRQKESAKGCAEALSSCVNTVFIFIAVIFCVVIAILLLNMEPIKKKSTSSSDIGRVRTGNKLNQKSDDYYCRYCGRKPSQTDGRTCYKARDPYLHVWLKQ